MVFHSGIHLHIRPVTVYYGDINTLHCTTTTNNAATLACNHGFVDVGALGVQDLLGQPFIPDSFIITLHFHFHRLI